MIIINNSWLIVKSRLYSYVFIYSTIGRQRLVCRDDVSYDKLKNKENIQTG